MLLAIAEFSTPWPTVGPASTTVDGGPARAVAA